MQNLLNRFLCLFLAFTFVLPLSSLSAQDVGVTPQVVDGVTIFADTRFLDKNYGAAIRVDMGEVSLRDLRDLKMSMGNEADVLPKRGQPVDLTLVVPKGLSPEDIQAFRDAVEPPLRERFATNKLDLRIREVDVADLQSAAKVSNAEIDHAVRLAEGGDAKVAGEFGEAFKTANEHTVRTWTDWKETFSSTVKRLKTNPETKSLAVASMIGLGSSMIPVTGFISTAGLNIYSIGQSLITFMYDQVGTSLSTRVIKWQVEHRFPLFKESRLVKFYNSTTLARAMAVNYAMNAFVGFELRALSYLSPTQHVASPYSWEFLSTLGGLNVVGSALGAGSDIGVKQSRMKGHISPRTEILLNSTFNLSTQINNALLGLGLMHFLPFGLAVEWVGKFTAFSFGRFLPPKQNRIIAIHPALRDPASLNNVKYLEGIESLVSKDGVTLENLREMSKNVDADGNIIEAEVRAQKTIREHFDMSMRALVDTWYKTCNYLRANLHGAPFWDGGP